MTEMSDHDQYGEHDRNNDGDAWHPRGSGDDDGVDGDDYADDSTCGGGHVDDGDDGSDDGDTKHVEQSQRVTANTMTMITMTTTYAMMVLMTLAMLPTRWWYVC